MVYIIKRDGEQEIYDSQKITKAIDKAFRSVGAESHSSTLKKITKRIEGQLFSPENKMQQLSVENIQDSVEKHLMENGYYEVGRSYILYRETRTKMRQTRLGIVDLIPGKSASGSAPGINGLDQLLAQIQQDFTAPEYDLEHLLHKFSAFYNPGEQSTGQESIEILIKAAVELTVQDAPHWEYISSRLAIFLFSERLRLRERDRGLETLWTKINYLVNEGLYGDYILSEYSKAEIDEFDNQLRSERNNLLTYSSFELLKKRYLIHSMEGELWESPQELFMGIAMHLCMNEKSDRTKWVIKTYNRLSKLQITVATPTLSNARKPLHQLSSCFIDTVPDSLDGIYRSISSFAQVSKLGGGMGLYFGKVRAMGSDIRGFKGIAGGILRWIKLANDTAVAVDQLGVRQGAVAVYLDIWHKDLPEFLQLKTNNGDDRMKAHDVFPGVCVPDYFWSLSENNIDGDWHLFCPHEVQNIMGFTLEDYWGEEWEAKYLLCVNEKKLSRRTLCVKDIVRLVIKSAVETGTPFIFNRDKVNEMNPNNHRGVIYCSNLCTEIAQNMSESRLLSKEIQNKDGEKIIAEFTRPGDYVVCNLASLVLGNIDCEKEGELEDVIFTAVRGLDNVIDNNTYPLPNARITNRKMRPIGLGVSGYHHWLANKGISWESEKHLNETDKLFERINFAAIDSSCRLAEEKGGYDEFPGSDWETGAYFEKRSYIDEKWQKLRKRIHKSGMRNGYLMAIAPTSSTSIIAGTTAGVDPIMSKFFLEEKKGMTIPRVAPNLSPRTFWLYKSAHNIDQGWSIKAAGIRQKHLDQSQSLNLYITTDFTLRQILNLYLDAWRAGIKTIYYVRSKSLDIEECESCTA